VALLDQVKCRAPTFNRCVSFNLSGKDKMPGSILIEEPHQLLSGPEGTKKSRRFPCNGNWSFEHFS
jgi:hypothetical protein